MYRKFYRHYTTLAREKVEYLTRTKIQHARERGREKGSFHFSKHERQTRMVITTQNLSTRATVPVHVAREATMKTTNEETQSTTANGEDDDTPTYISLRRATRSMGSPEEVDRTAAAASSAEDESVTNSSCLTFAQLVAAGFRPPESSASSAVTKRGTSGHERQIPPPDASDESREESDRKAPTSEPPVVLTQDLGGKEQETETVEEGTTATAAAMEKKTKENSTKRLQGHRKHLEEKASVLEEESIETSGGNRDVEEALKEDAVSEATVVNEVRLGKKRKAMPSLIAKTTPPADFEPSDDKTAAEEERPAIKLHHRLFTMSDNAKKRARPKKNFPEKVSLATKQKPEEGGGYHKRTYHKSSYVASVPEPPEPTKIVIRGSITHTVLQKLGRLDPRCLRNDPYDNPRRGKGKDEDKVSSQENAAELSEVSTNEVTHVPAADQDLPADDQGVTSDDGKPKSTKPSDSMETGVAAAATSSEPPLPSSSPVERGCRTSHIDEEAMPNAILRLCFRSTVLPQMSRHTPVESHRVVILHGPHRGQTGTWLACSRYCMRIRGSLSHTRLFR